MVEALEEVVESVGTFMRRIPSECSKFKESDNEFFEEYKSSMEISLRKNSED